MILNEVSEGRWLTPDPLGGDITNPQSLNRYAYALNNPTTLTDPLGLDSISSGQALQTCGHPGMTVPFGENPQTWCYNHEGIGGGSSPGAFFSNTADEFDVIFPTGCDEGGCGPVLNPPSAQAWWFLQSSLSVSNGGVFDGPGNLPGAAVRSQPVAVKNPCSFQGRALPPSAYAASGQQAGSSTTDFLLDAFMGWPVGHYLDPQPLASGNVFQRQAYGKLRVRRLHGIRRVCASHRPI